MTSLCKYYKIVEKNNKLAVHGHFNTLERAERHLKEIIPLYCKRGYFTDKSLTPDSFEILTVNDSIQQLADKALKNF